MDVRYLEKNIENNDDIFFGKKCQTELEVMEYGFYKVFFYIYICFFFFLKFLFQKKKLCIN
jgi:hypothetical protein